MKTVKEKNLIKSWKVTEITTIAYRKVIGG